jgi:hypothetical protein
MQMISRLKTDEYGDILSSLLSGDSLVQLLNDEYGSEIVKEAWKTSETWRNSLFSGGFFSDERFETIANGKYSKELLGEILKSNIVPFLDRLPTIAQTEVGSSALLYICTNNPVYYPTVLDSMVNNIAQYLTSKNLLENNSRLAQLFFL